MAVIRLADLLSSDVDVAGRAAYRLLEPALRQTVTAIVRGTLPGSCVCGRALCETCQEIVDDLVLRTVGLFRDAAAGKLPRTGDGVGVEVREWRTIVEYLTSPLAEETDVDTVGALLSAVPSGDRAGAGGDTHQDSHQDSRSENAHPGIRPEAEWARAAWAQLVHYPTRNLSTDLRRKAAVRRGMLARPARAIDQSPAAGPIRADEVAHDALAEFLGGVRDQVADPYALPRTAERFGLTPAETAEVLRRALELLRVCMPDLHATVLAAIPGRGVDQVPPRPRSGPSASLETDHLHGGPHPAGCIRERGFDEIEAAADAATARFELEHEIEADRVAPARGRTRSRRPRARLLRALLDRADGRRVDAVAACRRLLRLDDEQARREVERLAGLVAAAGVMWTDLLLVRAEERASP